MPAKIISHRGGAFLWPENSRRAFENSIQLMVDYIECDIHPSLDGTLFVLHDRTLERTTEARGAVHDFTAEQLSQTRLRGGEGELVPRLDDIVELLPASGTGLQIEIKTGVDGHPYPGILDATLRRLDAAGRRKRCGIIAFHAPTAAAAQQAGGLDHVAWLFDGGMLRGLGVEGVIGVAQAHGLQTVETHADALDADLVAHLRRVGLGIACWGANHAGSMARILSLGVDMMATDDPVTALSVRHEARR